MHSLDIFIILGATAMSKYCWLSCAGSIKKWSEAVWLHSLSFQCQAREWLSLKFVQQPCKVWWQRLMVREVAMVCQSYRIVWWEWLPVQNAKVQLFSFLQISCEWTDLLTVGLKALLPPEFTLSNQSLMCKSPIRAKSKIVPKRFINSFTLLRNIGSESYPNFVDHSFRRMVLMSILRQAPVSKIQTCGYNWC